MRIIAIRHGQTTHNAKKIMMGHGHGNLSKLGQSQAQALSKALKHQKLDFVYCSDLKRCKQTLQAISKYHKNVPVIFTEDLRERNWGNMEGKTYDEAQRARENYLGSQLKYKPKGGESLIELRKRVQNFINYIKKNHPDGNLLFVTSGGVLRMINSILTKISLHESYKKHKFENTSINEYEITKSKVKVLRFNDTKHL
jgi:alpha-ribazole phosphatase